MQKQFEKALLLGTAGWGWTVDRATASALLESWMDTGRRGIDAATNYPINRNPADFRAAESILLELIRSHGLSDLEVTIKIGSQDNLRSPEINLSPSFLLMMAEEYLRLFGSNLRGIMVHWDNRQDPAAITETLEALQAIRDRFGLRPGLSGIAHPEVYRQANDALGLAFDIQVKHNILQSDLERYKPLRDSKNRFYAYGINAGGVRLHASAETGGTFKARGGQLEKVQPLLDQLRAKLPDWNLALVRPPVREMHQIGLIYASWEPALHGIVLGVSSPAQLRETLDFRRNFEAFDYSDIHTALGKIAKAG